MCHLLLKNSQHFRNKQNSLIWLSRLSANHFIIYSLLFRFIPCSNKKGNIYSFLIACFSTSVLILFSLLRKLFPPNSFARSNIYLSRSKLNIVLFSKFSMSPLLLLEVIPFSSEYTKYTILIMCFLCTLQ